MPAYVNAQHAWPGAFDIDPASLTFRVPYRPYQNAWLLAWLDGTPNAVPKGAFRFFRATAGYPASSDFEITEEAMASGLVERLPDKTSDGHGLYLIRVPLNTADFYGFRDTAEDYLEFELTKPLALGRSYPDPIYYGYHPAGLPSSIHIVGITLEEAPFTYEVKPKQTAFVFEQPEKPSIAVAVTNTSNQPLVTKVSVSTKSYDGTEVRSLDQTIAIEPGQTQEAQFEFDLKKLGWHELNVEVEAQENQHEIRRNQLSLVLLPPNTRTYGDAVNETHFGTWNLWGHYTPFGVEGAAERATARDAAQARPAHDRHSRGVHHAGDGEEIRSPAERPAHGDQCRLSLDGGGRRRRGKRSSIPKWRRRRSSRARPRGRATSMAASGTSAGWRNTRRSPSTPATATAT